ncbi:NAD(P)-dependent oxidoreductase [Caulobacter segnis]|uniref:NAD-dependent epimerase/dehydratase n=2 Tax=Caulobacter segnis TaxID=88688 RepID=D5VGF0_CAUST|nr:NAD(P)-dependent oxidoreductase [Caulobacter segnis]ADG10269.1 NAD-dependent epimerase/dehydratase [Caulobacter segnis ATCC 21756]AVQ02008.1 NAD(P)-dependent oxidoreductase [Caulobacter segnis]
MRVLLLGAAGGIGSAIREGLAGRYTLMRLADIAPLSAPGQGEETVRVDLLDLDGLAAAMAGIDCVVHMAGVPVEPETNAWEQVLPANIVGVHNLFEAARLAGIKRVLFASSHHAAGFHRRETPTAETLVPRPDSYYGVSKVFGEAMGRMYADKFGLQVLSLRIGAYRERPSDPRQLAVWISPRDMVELVRCGVEAPDFGYATVYGVSANTRTFWDNSAVAFLGYQPRDNAEAWAAEIMAGPPEAPAAAPFQGGGYCAKGFVGDLGRVD